MVKLKFLLIGALFLVLFACQSVDDQQPGEGSGQPEPAAVSTPAEEPPAEPSVSPPSKGEEFTVSQEVFQETFQSISQMITALNKIINSKDYSTWRTHLTREYIETYSNADMLYEVSQQPTLKRYNIRLRSLADYFNYVVVPSRSEARLDDIIFLDENHVQAIMIINGRRSILYSLEKIDNTWKIGI